MNPISFLLLQIDTELGKMIKKFARGLERKNSNVSVSAQIFLFEPFWAIAGGCYS